MPETSRPLDGSTSCITRFATKAGSSSITRPCAPGPPTLQADEGGRHPMPTWPADVNGVRFGFMERRGKRFVAVRAQYGDADVVLANVVPIDTSRHLNGRRVSAEAITLSDGSAGALLGDMIEANPAQRPALVAVREQIREALDR